MRFPPLIHKDSCSIINRGKTRKALKKAGEINYLKITDAKISKIDEFLVSLDNKELSETSMSSLLREGSSGQNTCNSIKGCGGSNYVCPTNGYCPIPPPRPIE